MAKAEDRLTQVVDKRTAEAIKKAFDDGVKQGKKESHEQILGWLEAKYLTDKDRPKRGTPEAKAILDLAWAIGDRLRKELA